MSPSRQLLTLSGLSCSVALSIKPPAFSAQMREFLKGLPAAVRIVNLDAKIGGLKPLGAEGVNVGARATDIENGPPRVDCAMSLEGKTKPTKASESVIRWASGVTSRRAS